MTPGWKLSMGVKLRKPQRHHRRTPTKNPTKKSRQDLRQGKPRSYRASRRKRYRCFSSTTAQQSFRHRTDLSENQGMLETGHAQKKNSARTSRTLLPRLLSVKNSGRSISSRSEENVPTAWCKEASNFPLLLTSGETLC